MVDAARIRGGPLRLTPPCALPEPIEWSHDIDRASSAIAVLLARLAEKVRGMRPAMRLAM
jgi:hypothetical protein